MQTKKIFLHIGTDKTGSTAVQGFLKRNEQRMRRAGVRFVETGRELNHHGPLTDAVLRGDTAMLRKLRDEIEGAGAWSNVISFEGLYHLKQPRIEHLFAALAGWEIVVVLYIRRRSDIRASGLAQNMKRDGPVCADGALYGAKVQMDGPAYDYRAIIERWQRALDGHDGKGILRVRAYERDAFPGGNIVGDFLQAIEYPGGGELIEPQNAREGKRNINPSLAPAAQYLMSVVRSLGVPPGRAERVLRILEDFPDLDPKATVLSDEAMDELDAKYAEDDHWIGETYLGRADVFSKPRQFRCRAPSGEDFIKLFRRLYEQRFFIQLDPWGGESVDLAVLASRGAARVKRYERGLRSVENLTILVARPLPDANVLELHAEFAASAVGSIVKVESRSQALLEQATSSCCVPLSSVVNKEGVIDVTFSAGGNVQPIVERVALVKVKEVAGTGAEKGSGPD